MLRITRAPSIDLADYQDGAVVVGDVHSCAEALQDAVDELDTGSNYWVFAGDLFDRGPDPVRVWHIVHRFLAEGRASVVTGNHELNLRAANTGIATAKLSDTLRTRDGLFAAGISPEAQTNFVDSTAPLVRR